MCGLPHDLPNMHVAHQLPHLRDWVLAIELAMCIIVCQGHFLQPGVLPLWT